MRLKALGSTCFDQTSGRQGGGHGDDEPGVKPARDRGLPRHSVEILRDLGLSTEKIVAYHRRFPTPTANHVRKAVDKGHRIRHDGVAAS